MHFFALFQYIRPYSDSPFSYLFILQFPSGSSAQSEGMGTAAPAVKRKENVSWIDFVDAIKDNRIDEGAECLATLLQLDYKIAFFGAETFSEKFKKDETIVEKARSIPLLVARKSSNEALLLIYECFGYQGPVAILVLGEFIKQIS